MRVAVIGIDSVWFDPSKQPVGGRRPSVKKAHTTIQSFASLGWSAGVLLAAVSVGLGQRRGDSFGVETLTIARRV